MGDLVAVSRVDVGDGVFVHVISIGWAFRWRGGVIFRPLFSRATSTVCFGVPVGPYTFHHAFATGRPYALDLLLVENPLRSGFQFSLLQAASMHGERYLWPGGNHAGG